MFKKLIVIIWTLFLLSPSIYAATYPADNPTVVSVSPAPEFSVLYSFSETLGAGNQGSVKYQISNNGTNWYYWNGSNWAAATAGYSHSNTAVEINTNCAQFDDDAGGGNFYFKAFLHSDGTQQVELDQVTLGYTIQVEVRPVFGNTTVDQGDIVKIDVQVVDISDGNPLNSAACTINIYNPSGTKVVDGASMTYVSGSNGIYRYSYTVPDVSGSYLYEVTATWGSKSGYGAANFEVGTLAADVTATLEDTGTTLPTQIGGVQTTVDSVETKVDAVKTDTAAILVDTGTTLPTQISGVETKVDAVKTDTAAILVDTETTLPAQIDGVETKVDTMQGDVTAIKTETDKIPDIKTETDKLKAEILNRETSVKSGSTIKIRYRSQSGLSGANRPEVDVFDANNTQKVTDGKMSEIGSTGVYVYNLSLDSGWGTGEFTVVCSDTTTGKLDSLTLTVLTTDLADIRSAVTTVDDEIEVIDGNIDTLISEVGSAQISAIKAETDKITSVKTTVEHTNTNVANINLDTDAVIEKWGSTDGDTLAAYVDNVESRLGTSLDTSTADTVFGDIKTLQEKWGDYAASDIYDITAGVTVVPYTVPNEVLAAAVDAYNQFEALRTEVRTLGKTAPAYEILVGLQVSLNRINAALEKLETALTHPFYAQVLEVANQLKATGVVKGGEKVMSLYEVFAKQAGDIEYLKAKLEELKSVAELSKEIVAEKKKETKKAIIRTSW